MVDKKEKEDCTLCEHYMLLKREGKIERGCELGLNPDNCHLFKGVTSYPKGKEK